MKEAVVLDRGLALAWTPFLRAPEYGYASGACGLLGRRRGALRRKEDLGRFDGGLPVKETVPPPFFLQVRLLFFLGFVKVLQSPAMILPRKTPKREYSK